MRSAVLLLLLLPFTCFSQQRDDEGGDMHAADLATTWTALIRPTLSNPLTAYYRFVDEGGKYHLELKASAGGVPFIVTQDAKLEFAMENGEVVTLYNKKWQRACKGCGSKGGNSDIPGVTLEFDLKRGNVFTLSNSYLGHMSLELPDNVLGGKPTLRRTETFREQADYFLYCIEHK